MATAKQNITTARFTILYSRISKSLELVQLVRREKHVGVRSSHSSWPCHRVRLHPGYSATGHPPKRQHPVVCKARPWWVLHSQHGLTIQCRNCRRGPSICMRFSLGNGNTKGCYPLFLNLQKLLLIQKPKQSAGRWLKLENLKSKPWALRQTWPSEGQQGRFKFPTQPSDIWPKILNKCGPCGCASLKDSIHDFFLWTNVDQHPPTSMALKKLKWRNWRDQRKTLEKLWLFPRLLRNSAGLLCLTCSFPAEKSPHEAGHIAHWSVIQSKRKELSGLDSREWGCLKNWIDVTRKSMDFMEWDREFWDTAVLFMFLKTPTKPTIVRTSKPAAFSCCSASWLPNLSYFHRKKPKILKLSK